MQTKKKSGIWQILQAICFVLLLLVISVPEMPGAALTALKTASASSEMYYGRSKLSGTELAAYDKLCQSIADKVMTDIDLQKYNLTVSEFEKIFHIYRMDHGEHYWMPVGSYQINYNKNTNKFISVNFAANYVTGFDDAAFATAAADYLALVDNTMSEYEIALTLHDALIEKVHYVKAANAHNAYGAIVEGLAVCEGYAEAYQYLLRRCGIMSYLVTGTANGEGHEWNLVRLDGKYYYTDVTWDDPLLEDPLENNVDLYHAYFNIPTQYLIKDHNIDDVYNLLPNCTAFDKIYDDFIVTDKYDVQAIVDKIKPVGKTAVVSIFYTGTDVDDNFATWLGDNIIQIKESTVYKMQTITYGYVILGQERQLYLIGETVPATTVTLDASELSLFIGHSHTLHANVEPSAYCSDIPRWTSSNPSVVKVDKNGKVQAISLGNAVITVTVGTKIVTCNVVVQECTHEYNAVIWVWDENGKTAVAKTDCIKCDHHLEIKATVTSETLVEPTESANGEVKYTAVIEINGVSYSDSKIVEIPPISAAEFWQNAWNSMIDWLSFGGVINGYLGLGIVCVGGVAVLGILKHILFKRRRR